MLRRLLIANRAEIAERVIRTAALRGTETVAVFADPDADLPYVQMADQAVHLRGAAAQDTYLRAELLVDAAIRTGADAVHPGYGFLSENAAFARACEAAGLVFVGPPPDVIDQMGSKIDAKALMAAAGVPVLEGATVDEDTDPARLAALGARVGYPLLVKASFGGGGRGMRVVERADELAASVDAAAREAASAFGNGAVFLERLVLAPRHVEVQVVADQFGTVAHLFERECSIQRRHQKVVEESPAPGLSEAKRVAIREAAVTAASAIGYVNAGTVEFVVDREGQFSFLEVNTRLQVEHPVTELVTGLDLVELQLQIAEGQPLPSEVLDATSTGHAIEVRLYAEDAEDNYLPTTGRFSSFEIPTGGGVRVDAGYTTGSVVSTNYDAMLAKVISWAPSREQSARQLTHALRGARLHGVRTNRDLLIGILGHEEFLAGSTDTAFLDRHPPGVLAQAARDGNEAAACVVAALWQRLHPRADSPQPSGIPAGWRNVGPADQPRTYRLRGEAHTVRISGRHADPSVTLDGVEVEVRELDVRGASITLAIDGRRVRAALAQVDDQLYVDGTLGTLVLTEEPRLRPPGLDEAPGSMHAPLPGSVRRVTVSVGDEVAAGEVLMVLEAMKMEHSIRATTAGRVASVLVADGAQVDAGAVLAVIAPVAEDGT